MIHNFGKIGRIQRFFLLIIIHYNVHARVSVKKNMRFPSNVLYNIASYSAIFYVYKKRQLIFIETFNAIVSCERHLNLIFLIIMYNCIFYNFLHSFFPFFLFKGLITYLSFEIYEINRCK